MTEKVPMLKAGFEALEAEFKNLKSVERPAVVQAIADAREHGDLSENAEYHAAKEKQSFIEGRLQQLESMISRAQVIDPTTLSGNKVVFGSTVTLIDEDDKEVTYQIVGEEEGDIKKGKLSFKSPIARALIGREVGADAEVHAPSGTRYFEITKIEFK